MFAVDNFKNKSHPIHTLNFRGHLFFSETDDKRSLYRF